jgi:hypothetical protein
MRSVLPPRKDFLIFCEMSEQQAFEYQSIVQSLFSSLGIADREPISSEPARKRAKQRESDDQQSSVQVDNARGTTAVPAVLSSLTTDATTVLDYSNALPYLTKLRLICNMASNEAMASHVSCSSAVNEVKVSRALPGNTTQGTTSSVIVQASPMTEESLFQLSSKLQVRFSCSFLPPQHIMVH